MKKLNIVFDTFFWLKKTCREPWLLKNDDFGFQCLHYLVSEASEKLTIVVLNKKKAAGKVKVKTIDGDALAGEDYEAYESPKYFYLQKEPCNLL